MGHFFCAGEFEAKSRKSQGPCDASRFSQFNKRVCQLGISLAVGGPVADELPFAGHGTAFEDGVLTVPVDHFSLQAEAVVLLVGKP